jgi:hypothetical protein
MQRDLHLRAAARAIYDTVYPGEEWTPVPFDEAERHETIHYRQAVQAAERVAGDLYDPPGVPIEF